MGSISKNQQRATWRFRFITVTNSTSLVESGNELTSEDLKEEDLVSHIWHLSFYTEQFVNTALGI